MIASFDENLRKIAQEMFLVMYAAEGIGLAAPQVGINKRLMVFNGKMRICAIPYQYLLTYMHTYIIYKLAIIPF